MVRARVQVHAGFIRAGCFWCTLCAVSFLSWAVLQASFRCCDLVSLCLLSSSNSGVKKHTQPPGPNIYIYICVFCDFLFSVICFLQCLQRSKITAGPIARCHGIFWMLGPEIPLSKQRLTGQGAVAPRFR